MSADAAGIPPLSIPVRSRAPRVLDAEERSTLAAVADALIPSTEASPAPSTEPDFWDKVAIALDARADAFDTITARLSALRQVEGAALLDRLERLDDEDPAAFQALSTVVTGAWLLTAGTRDRIGYHGQQAAKSGVEEAVDEISSGILEPVLARYESGMTRWIR